MAGSGEQTAKMSYSKYGKTRHAQKRLRTRAPLESFDFNVRTINRMIDKGEATVKDAKFNRKEVTFRSDGAVYVVIMDKKRKFLITVKKL